MYLYSGARIVYMTFLCLEGDHELLRFPDQSITARAVTT